MLQRFTDNRELVWATATLSLVVFLGSLIIIPLLIARMPVDYFLHKKPPPSSWRAQHRVLRISLLAVKNIFGAAFVLAGISMLILPGQGILTILIGLTLLNFPGKRQLELWFVSRPSVLKAINWIRRKANRPPLLLPALSQLGRQRPYPGDSRWTEKLTGRQCKPEPSPCRAENDSEK